MCGDEVYSLGDGGRRGGRGKNDCECVCVEGRER